MMHYVPESGVVWVATLVMTWIYSIYFIPVH